MSLRVVVVGAGFGGIGAAKELGDAGHEVTVYEASDHIGGTWYHNQYPGCCCDVPSVLYSFSFAQNPDWSRLYPAQPELRAYLEAVVDRFGLRDRIRTGTRVTATHFDETTATWQITLDTGEEVTADAVVAAVGPLSRPKLPALAGLDDFEGTWFHTAAWDHDHDLTGERVALVGTGASAVQVAPEIADDAGHLLVFQRTPPWIVPRPDMAIGAAERARRRWIPGWLRTERWSLYWSIETLSAGFTGVVPRMRDAWRALGTAHIEAQVSDPDVRALVTPDYEPGCKRVIFSSDWYPTLGRDDVTLVPEAVDRITPTGLITASGEHHDVDTIIYATGFDVSTTLAPMTVIGLDGVDLDEVWAGGATNHLGTTVPGFPNFFVLAGPNTGLGHSSIVFMIEAQLHYVRGALAAAEAKGCALEVDALAARRSYERLQDRMADTVWATGGCSSWYQNRDGGGIDAMWPGSTVEFWARTRRFDPGRYRHVKPRG